MKSRLAFASGLPITPRERREEAVAAARAAAIRAARRRVCPDMDRYARVPTAAELRLSKRILGERE